MALIRILRTAAVTVTHTFIVDEGPQDASGPVTVSLKRLDGTLVEAATAGHPGPPGEYTYPVPPQAQLDELTLDWTGSIGGAATTVRDSVEIVGGFMFGIAEARHAHRFLANVNDYSTSFLAEKRIQVEQEFDRICGQAWVPRFARVFLSGRDTDRLGTPHSMIRAVRAVSINGVAMAAPDVALIGFSDSGVLWRPGGAIWPAGHRNIIVELEHGWDAPASDVKDVAILRMRSKVATTTTGIPDRAISYTHAEGGTYRLSTPNRERTGIPEIDGVLAKPGYTRAPRAVVA